MEIHPSALKHDVTAADVEHAVRNSMAVDEVADDPVRFMVLGPDTAGRMLEIVVADTKLGPLVIHAMPMRLKYRRMLPKGGRGKR